MIVTRSFSPARNLGTEDRRSTELRPAAFLELLVLAVSAQVITLSERSIS